MKVEMTIFDPDKKCICVKFETTETEFNRMMELLHCQYDKDFRVWWGPGSNTAYEIIER